jgi:hypothetical protein
MKKKLFLSMAALLLGATSAFAQYSPSASTEVFKFSPFNDSNLLTLFYNALQDGRQYPTTAEFEAAGNFNIIKFLSLVKVVYAEFLGKFEQFCAIRNCRNPKKRGQKKTPATSARVTSCATRCHVRA